jgi:hypothetical protein
MEPRKRGCAPSWLLPSAVFLDHPVHAAGVLAVLEREAPDIFSSKKEKEVLLFGGIDREPPRSRSSTGAFGNGLEMVFNFHPR